ncbi:MAG: GldG family protein [Clostridia bacterium]|nr:GldG family protein [Clostridia bacterium]
MMDKNMNETPERTELDRIPDPALSSESDAAKTKKAKKQRLGDGRRFRYGAAATVLTVVVVIAAILLNLLVDRLEARYPLTLDLTEQQLLTLSEESRAIAKAVKDDVQITVCYNRSYFESPNTGYPEIDNICKQFYAALREYRSLSGGKVSYEFVDLTAEPIKAAKLSQYNVSNGSILFVCGERSALTTLDNLYSFDDNYQYYLYGYASEYQFDSLVEKALATNIQKVTNGALTTVTLLTGHGEDEKVVSAVSDLLKSNGYDVLTLDITTQATFDESSSVAILPAPSTDYADDELKKLRAWTENGGRYDRHLAYIVDYYHFLPTLSEFFSDNYGIEVTSNWVVETAPTRMFGIYTQYAYGDVATTDFTSADDTWVKSPITFQLLTHWDDDREASRYTQSVVTFPQSAELIDLNTYLAFEEAQNADASDASEPDEAVENPLDQKPAASYPITGMAYSVTKKTVDGKLTQSNALVCGSSGYFSLYLTDAAVSNEETFLSVFNGLIGNEDAVQISSKSVAAEKVDFGSDAVKKGVGLGVFTIGLPVVMLIIALVVFLRRKNL